MNDIKEKSAVGMAVPATETDNKSIVSITDFCGNVNSYSENMTAILASLSDTLRLTREGMNIESIRPVAVPMMNENYVQVAARITYKSGRTKDIDIDCDVLLSSMTLQKRLLSVEGGTGLKARFKTPLSEL